MNQNNGFTLRTMKKKESILDATESLLIKKGPNITSIIDIASLANVSQVTIYNYFGSKIDLFKCVMERYFERILKKTEKIMRSDLSFQDKLNIFLDMQTSEPFALSMFSNIDWNHPELIKFMKEYSDKYSPYFVKQLFELGRREGFLDKDIPIEAVMDYLNGIMAVFIKTNFYAKNSEYKIGLRKLFYYGFFGKAFK